MCGRLLGVMLHRSVEVLELIVAKLDEHRSQ